MHATIEEEIFYPAAREETGDDEVLDEAVVEHAAAKDLIAQIKDMRPDDDLYDAKVKVLGEQIDHHVKEEEGELFLKRKSPRWTWRSRRSHARAQKPVDGRAGEVCGLSSAHPSAQEG